MAAKEPSSVTVPETSAITNLIASSASSDPVAASTIQILHNLQHQHLWTSLQIHDLRTTGTNPTSPDDKAVTPFIISGIPPHHVYIHPDEQLYMLERGLRDDDVELERIFVVPTVQGQSWSLRKMAAVFDTLPDEAQFQALDISVVESNEAPTEEKAAKLAEYYEHRKKARLTKEWGGKRILLAMVDRGMGGDGTVVYYIIQEGAVKPRQN
ncbi:tRNA-splicing endonuclease subunit Sen15 [Aspergillus avenaceus]|uniref:tRNA-splicing endonuclease subunit Sen15 n=1 Tax=Aspergillus avenaceus TaxID=36643 RepID=A0A5N6TFV0_ASPAV|nr:tRNA-splicing endonuclease subunit Sen15 [Aspergillus avenaceus]